MIGKEFRGDFRVFDSLDYYLTFNPSSKVKFFSSWVDENGTRIYRVVVS